ncbi:hypothetical protein Peur_068072 [Populus x canadensis]
MFLIHVPRATSFEDLPLDRSLCDVLKDVDGRCQDELFGGKSVLSGGHFCQIILVIFDDQDAVLVRIPYELQLQGFNDPVASMVSCIYPNIERPQVDPSYFKERAIVTPKNIIVSEINDFTFNITQGHLEIYLNTNSVEASFGHGNNTELLYPIEFINQLEFNGVPSHALALKLGTPVMLHRNLNPVRAIQGSSKAKDATYFGLNIIEGDFIEVKGFYI